MPQKKPSFTLDGLIEERDVPGRDGTTGRRMRQLASTTRPDSAFARAFRYEADAFSELALPGILRLIELVPDREDRGLAMVFEARRGLSLGETHAKQGPLGARAVLGLAVQLATTMAEAHERDWALGEPSPFDIELDASGRPFWTKLRRARRTLTGDAEALEWDDGDVRALAAPERKTGGAPTPRSDVYALAALLLVCADRAESAETIRASRFERLQSALPPGLWGVLLRCLAEPDGQRPADGRALLGLLVAECPRGFDAGLAVRAWMLGRPEHEGESAPDRAPHRALWRLLPPLGAIFGAIALTLLVHRSFVSPAAGEEGSALQSPGYLLVVAQPWADIWVDGKKVDTTPRAAPIEVPAGVRQVVFRHPSAPEQVREVEVKAGETVRLNVIMQVPRPEPSTATSAIAPTP